MYEIEQGTLVERPTAVIRATVAVEELPTWFGEVYPTVAATLSRAGIEPSGPPFARYRILDDPATFEIEAGFPVPALIARDGDVVPSVLPGGPAVATWHEGPYDGLGAAYAALASWIEAEGARPDGPAWESYYREPTGDPATWLTEIIQPYRVKVLSAA